MNWGSAPRIRYSIFSTVNHTKEKKRTKLYRKSILYRVLEYFHLATLYLYCTVFIWLTYSVEKTTLKSKTRWWHFTFGFNRSHNFVQNISQHNLKMFQRAFVHVRTVCLTQRGWSQPTVEDSTSFDSYWFFALE